MSQLNNSIEQNIEFHPEILSERIKKDSDRYGKLIEKLKLKLD